jgi:dihydrofolate reductase
VERLDLPGAILAGQYPGVHGHGLGSRLGLPGHRDTALADHDRRAVGGKRTLCTSWTLPGRRFGYVDLPRQAEESRGGRKTQARAQEQHLSWIRDSSSAASGSSLPQHQHHATEEAMRKIIESTLVSADGVVGSPPLWAMDYRDEEVTRDALERLSGSDAMLMGRGTYELFAATWPGQTDDFAQRMNAIRKYVFSSTLTSADWSNSTIVRGDILAEAARIKEQDGKDLALFGHGRLAQTLLENGLIDELRLSIHPVLAGAGLPQFSNGRKTPLTLVSAKTFTTGVVVLSYQRAGA